MSSTVRTIAVSLGFTVGFLLLLDGGASLVVVLLSLAHAELPSQGDVASMVGFLVIPLLAFRRYDVSRRPADSRPS
jgi:hypothetical protein